MLTHRQMLEIADRYISKDKAGQRPIYFKALCKELGTSYEYTGADSNASTKPADTKYKRWLHTMNEHQYGEDLFTTQWRIVAIIKEIIDDKTQSVR